jgi:vWA-MoxR associated protein C-terminal domain
LNRSSLLLEFAVPRNLLNVDFDQWSIPEGTGSNSSRSYLLGVRYAVVVRDLERMSPIDDRSWWRARWQCLCDSGSQVADGVRWVSLTADHSYDSLTAELLREHARKQVCLALASAPVTDTLSAELLEAGLTAGMPAAIWLRQVGTDSQAADGHYLGLAVKSGVLGRLPLTVLDLRQEAEAKRRDADHQGRRLSLLWDDPDRTWKPPPFNMPHLSLNGADE